MKKPPKPLAPITVSRDSPKFAADIRELEKDFRNVLADVDKCVNETILPAVTQDPLFPNRQGGGTPLVENCFHIRVSNGSAGSGDRGGFRMRYHWDREARRIQLLSICLRRDDKSLPRKAVQRLLEKAKGSPKAS
jgi:mRNA-degrading endonuclease RelE of RelBE toxin-antitoxin system